MAPNLTKLHPELLRRVQKILDAMKILDHPMKITQGVRTTAEQQALFAQGRTRKGPVVTNADGITKKSNHQTQADGLGHAVDCAFDDPVPFAETHPWALYGACARAVGLTWGGDFHTILDRPHVEFTS